MPRQKKGSVGPWEPFKKAKGLRRHEGHACQETTVGEEGKFDLLLNVVYAFSKLKVALWTVLSISLFISGPEGDQETDLQEGWKVPQGVQADVQAWDPHVSYGSQSGELLCATRAQTGLCYQDQRVSCSYGYGVMTLTWNAGVAIIVLPVFVFGWWSVLAQSQSSIYVLMTCHCVVCLI